MANERENIVCYLRHCATMQIGTVLSSESREIVGWCASWIENRLDEKWARDVAAMTEHGNEEQSRLV